MSLSLKLQQGIERFRELGLNDPGYEKFAQKAIRSGNPELNYRIALEIKGANYLGDYGKAVIASNDPMWNYYFARDISNADIKAHAQVVIESGSSHWNDLFAANVKAANKNAHKAAYSSKPKHLRLVHSNDEAEIEKPSINAINQGYDKPRHLRLVKNTETEQLR